MGGVGGSLAGRTPYGDHRSGAAEVSRARFCRSEAIARSAGSGACRDLGGGARAAHRFSFSLVREARGQVLWWRARCADRTAARAWSAVCSAADESCEQLHARGVWRDADRWLRQQLTLSSRLESSAGSAGQRSEVPVGGCGSSASPSGRREMCACGPPPREWTEAGAPQNGQEGLGSSDGRAELHLRLREGACRRARRRRCRLMLFAGSCV